jgi:opacity protein-like surface antigen
MTKLMTAVVVVACTFSAARADPPPSTSSYLWSGDSRLPTGFGVSILLGAGATGFTNEAMRNSMTDDVNAMWDAHLTLGSHLPFAFDIGYTGSGGTIHPVKGMETQTGTLIGNAVEGSLRWNVLPHGAWNPYVQAGLGWRHYQVRSAQFNLGVEGVSEHDNQVTYPVGGGLQWRAGNGLVIDAHATYRPVTGSGLVQITDQPGAFVSMNSWEAGLSGGYEF